MRNTVIPAQITTVEDKIAGNLNLTQILLLMTPVLITTLLYSLVSPVMKLTIFKMILVGFLSLVCGVLAIRVKGRVILNWLAVFIKYKLRPSFFVFNKNDCYLREIETPVKNNNQVKVIKKLPVLKIEKSLLEVDAVKLLHVINNQKNSLRFVFNQKGGLRVAVETSKK
jgi:hypothetical protein